MIDNDFIINAGPQGTFKKSGQYQTLPADVDAMFDKWRTSPPGSLSLYFHGGLVNETNGLETARKMAKHISGAGSAPVCLVWETGLVETVSTNIIKVSESKLFGKIVNVLLKKLSQKLGFDAAGGRGAREMLSDEKIAEELNTEDPFAGYDWNLPQNDLRGSAVISELPADMDANAFLLEDELKAEYTVLVDTDPEFTEAISETGITDTSDNQNARGVISTAILVKHLAAITIRVLKRFFNKTDHSFYPTVIEEIFREFYIAEVGAWVWGSMKIKAKDIWKSNSSKSGIEQYAGRYFLDKLVAYKKEFPATKIHLIGHSAGSIAICYLLKTLHEDFPEPDRFKADKVLFMAPACRCDLFHEEMVMHPERFADFRMFTMKDEFEKKDRLIPHFYTHSLLYLISGILEEEGSNPDAYILGLERHISGLASYADKEILQKINRFLYPPSLNRLILSQTTVTDGGFTTKSLSHGGFDDDPDTIASITFLIA